MSKTLLLVGVVALTTIAIRFAPFVLFKKKTPEVVQYLGGLLPYAIMAMLVVYCLKDTEVLSGSHGLPELISVILVVVLHKIKHNTLLSIVLGTVCYMLLIHFVF